MKIKLGIAPIAWSNDDMPELGGDTPIEKCLDIAANQGFDGVEILQVQMEDFTPSYLQKIKKHAFLNGLDLMGFSTHQDFVDPDPRKRRHNVEQTIFYIKQQYKREN